MRKGVDADHLTYLDAGRIAEAEGAAAVALHARTAADFYSGTADWPAIARLKEAVTSIPVLGNGDIWSADDAAAHGRGDRVRRRRRGPRLPGPAVAVRRPRRRASRAGPNACTPGLGDVLATLRRHLVLLVEHYAAAYPGDAEHRACRDIRKHIAWYLKGYQVGSQARAQLALVESLAGFDAIGGAAGRRPAVPRRSRGGAAWAGRYAAVGRPARRVARQPRARPRRGRGAARGRALGLRWLSPAVVSPAVVSPAVGEYAEADRERYLPEPPKQGRRGPFVRDRARIVHSSALRRLAAKTQVVGPGTDDFVRNRLTHSLEVAQIGRDLAMALGCDGDVVEAACLAHDLGHPPFGHNGEDALAEVAAAIGGFEGNAQTLRRADPARAEGRRAGRRARRPQPDPGDARRLHKYPWARGEAPVWASPAKFGVYPDDDGVFAWLREGAGAERRCLEAQVMDLADDVAYSVHDVEDAIVGGHLDPRVLASPAEVARVVAQVRSWYLPGVSEGEVEAAVARLRALPAWLGAFDRSHPSLAALKDMTSELIGRFSASVEAATRECFGAAPLVRYAADVVVPRETLVEIATLKGLAAVYVMTAASPAAGVPAAAGAADGARRGAGGAVARGARAGVRGGVEGGGRRRRTAAGRRRPGGLADRPERHRLARRPDHALTPPPPALARRRPRRRPPAPPAAAALSPPPAPAGRGRPLARTAASKYMLIFKPPTFVRRSWSGRCRSPRPARRASSTGRPAACAPSTGARSTGRGPAHERPATGAGRGRPPLPSLGQQPGRGADLSGDQRTRRSRAGSRATDGPACDAGLTTRCADHAEQPVAGGDRLRRRPSTASFAQSRSRRRACGHRPGRSAGMGTASTSAPARAAHAARSRPGSAIRAAGRRAVAIIGPWDGDLAARSRGRRGRAARRPGRDAWPIADSALRARGPATLRSRYRTGADTLARGDRGAARGRVADAARETALVRGPPSRSTNRVCRSPTGRAGGLRPGGGGIGRVDGLWPRPLSARSTGVPGVPAGGAGAGGRRCRDMAAVLDDERRREMALRRTGLGGRAVGSA